MQTRSGWPQPPGQRVHGTWAQRHQLGHQTSGEQVVDQVVDHEQWASIAPDQQPDHSSLDTTLEGQLSRRDRLRAERQAAHAGPARIRLRTGVAVVVLAVLVSWLLVSWLSGSSSSSESVPDPPTETAEGSSDGGMTEGSQEGAPEDADSQSAADGHEPSPNGSEGTGDVLVHITGAVEQPQVVILTPGERVLDAVEAAGGVTDDAAAEGINMAAEAVDGTHIHVPTVEELEEGYPPSEGSQDGTSNGATTPGHADEGGTVNINAADEAQLEELPGIGPALAERITSHREQNGEFGSLDELAAVSGIGPTILEDIADEVSW